jgi:hypothetical protein
MASIGEVSVDRRLDQVTKVCGMTAPTFYESAMPMPIEDGICKKIG